MSFTVVLFVVLFSALWIFLIWTTFLGVATGVIRGKGWSGWEALTGKLYHRDASPVMFWLVVFGNTIAIVAMPIVVIYELFFL
jgi:hypothetical protein